MKATQRTLILLACLLLTPPGTLHAAGKPNLVILFTDDMGYSDIGAYGCKDIPTSHLDRIAAEGTKFTSAYTVAPICVPLRMGLMSGKFPARFGVFNNVYAPEQNQLWIQQTTLADVLRKQGYRTANIGKWHLSGNSSGHGGNDLGGFLFKPPHERKPGVNAIDGVMSQRSAGKVNGAAKGLRGFLQAGDSVVYAIDIQHAGNFELPIAGEHLERARGWEVRIGETVVPLKEVTAGQLSFAPVALPPGSAAVTVSVRDSAGPSKDQPILTRLGFRPRP